MESLALRFWPDCDYGVERVFACPFVIETLGGGGGSFFSINFLLCAVSSRPILGKLYHH